MYDDKNIDTFGDIFETDENSAARVGIGYKVHPFLNHYIDYIHTFRFDEVEQRYVVQKRFEPQLALTVKFPVGECKK